MLVVNYRKYESTNPYIMRLSIADNELALNVGKVFVIKIVFVKRTFVPVLSSFFFCIN